MKKIMTIALLSITLSTMAGQELITLPSPETILKNLTEAGMKQTTIAHLQYDQAFGGKQMTHAEILQKIETISAENLKKTSPERFEWAKIHINKMESVVIRAMFKDNPCVAESLIEQKNNIKA